MGKIIWIGVKGIAKSAIFSFGTPASRSFKPETESTAANATYFMDFIGLVLG